MPLPFFDDFSNPGPYPKEKLWMEKNVFVNNTYPLYPPTYGAATFDGLDENGNIYAQARPGSAFWADTLTARPIDLSELTPADSVYLSFYYQPGGGYGDAGAQTRRGVAPTKADVFNLEFYNPKDTLWTIVWSASGTNLSEFCSELENEQCPLQEKGFFRQVMIPVNSEVYFQSDFRFRFRAMSTIDANSKSGGSQWHLDYVYMDSKRSGDVGTSADVTFAHVSGSLLKEYTAVPRSQFDKDMLRPGIDITLTNLSAQTLGCRYRYEILDEQGETLYSYPSSGDVSVDIYPFVNNGYRTSPNLSPVPMGYDFSGITSYYSVRHILSSGIRNEFSLVNDTLVVGGELGCEFAYDDGSAEAGWGLNYAGGAVAYAFDLVRPDTLTAVRIFFNRSLNGENEVPFHIVVWGPGSSETTPGAVIYKEGGFTVTPVEGINAFGRYVLSEPLVLPAGRFYVGVEQTSSTFLNIGFDQNSSLKDKIFYSYYNTFDREWVWMPTLFSGALMIRPAFGAAALQDVSTEPSSGAVSASARHGLRVYPNPVRDGRFHIDLPGGLNQCVNPAEVQVSLYDLGGRRLWQKPYSSVFFAGESKGVYIVRATCRGRVLGVSKLVVL